jgi:cytochrome c-type biogenesis protein CcmF
VGIVGVEFFQSETQGRIAIGERLSLDSYSVEYVSLSEFQTEDGRLVDRAVVNVYEDGQFLRQLYPRRDYYYESQQSMTIPGLRSTLEDDIYVLLVDWEPLNAGSITIKLYHNPLINWIWIGGLVFIVGNMVAAWPVPEAADLRTRSQATRQAAEAKAG